MYIQTDELSTSCKISGAVVLCHRTLVCILACPARLEDLHAILHDPHEKGNWGTHCKAIERERENLVSKTGRGTAPVEWKSHLRLRLQGFSSDVPCTFNSCT